jgi:hypothetical protein
MLPFGVTIPATVPQGSEIPEALLNNSVYRYRTYLTWEITDLPPCKEYNAKTQTTCCHITGGYNEIATTFYQITLAKNNVCSLGMI